MLMKAATTAARPETFADVVPEQQDATVRSFRVHSIFELARMLSIYENEAGVDKKRCLMRTPSYRFITNPGVEKAYSFYKRHCEHLLKALLYHDGNPIAMVVSHVNTDINSLNDLANTDIIFAHRQWWDDATSKAATRMTLICPPEGFRVYDRVAHMGDNTSIVFYNGPRDLVDHLKEVASLNTVIFITPTSEKSFDAEE